VDLGTQKGGRETSSSFLWKKMMMRKTALKGNLILPDTTTNQGYVVLEGQKISGIFGSESQFQRDEVEVIDYDDAYIAPGFVDLHLHGALGKDVMDGDEESLRTIAEHQAKNGVTGFLGSTMSAPLDTVLEAIRVLKKVAMDPLPSAILGVHVEGPFLSVQEKGAHSVSFIKGMTETECERLLDAADGLPIVLSLAPEVGDNMRWIPGLKARGIVLAIGHSDATYDQALESFSKGISHATHLYNAMSGFDHREPGVVGAVLDSDDITAELIVDGIHVHPAALRLAVARKGPQRICLITDSIMATGVGDGVYSWGEEEVEVKGNIATIRGSQVLAGSVLTLNRAVNNMVDWTGVTINQAIDMASLNPARVLGMQDKIGSIQTGKLANLVVLDKEFRVVDTISRGKSIMTKGS
jgi:N-acetylglucosamine-6-phosphate deacetylase